MRIIGFVGMPGSGKSTASEVAQGMGLGIVAMGDVIRQETALRGLQPTDENLGMVGCMLRAREGPKAIAKRTLELAKRTERELVVVDGLRSRDEVEFFRANSEDFRLVEIDASLEARLRRLASRGRSDDQCSMDDASEDSKVVSSCQDLSRMATVLERRECRELGWGMCEAFKDADLRINNDGDLEEFRGKVEALLREMES